MGTKTKEVGGGPAVGLANDFVKWLQQGLNTGSFGGVSAGQRQAGADPMGSTQGISAILNDILSGGAGNIGGAMGEMITRNTDRQVGDLRSRFGAQGGTAFGTGAQHAEGVLRAEQAPQLVQSIGQLQLAALAPLLSLMGGLAGRGIPQREVVQQQSGFGQALGILGPLAGSIAGGPAGGALAGLFSGGGLPPSLGNILPEGLGNLQYPTPINMAWGN